MSEIENKIREALAMAESEAEKIEPRDVQAFAYGVAFGLREALSIIAEEN